MRIASLAAVVFSTSPICVRILKHGLSTSLIADPYTNCPFEAAEHSRPPHRLLALALQPRKRSLTHCEQCLTLCSQKATSGRLLFLAGCVFPIRFPSSLFLHS